MVLPVHRLLSASLLSALVACSGSGTGSYSAPTGLVYAPPSEVLAVGVECPPIQPVIEGGLPSQYKIEPQLPGGLLLDGQGVVRGLPTDPSARQLYTVTGSNSAGTVSASFELEVIPKFDAPRLVFGVHLDENRIAIWRFDPSSGDLVPNGSVRTAQFPVRAAVDPLGRFLFVSSGGQGIGVHRILPTTGGLGPVQVADTDGGSFELELKPDGRCLYVTNLGSQSVEAFQVDTLTGQLTKFGASIPLASPTDLAVSPDGRFLAVALYQPGGIAVFELDPSTGAIGALRAAEIADTPLKLAFSEAGDWLYSVSVDGSVVQRFRFAPEASILTLTQNMPTPLTPVGLTRTGSILAVAASDGRSLARYAIAPDGALSYLDERSLPGQPGSVAALPSGQLLTPLPKDAWLYVHASSEGQSPAQALHLTRPGLLDVVVGYGPSPLFPRSQNLYVAATTSEYVHAFSTLAGAVQEVGFPTQCGQRPSGLALDETRARLFTAMQLSDTIGMQSVTALDGALDGCGLNLPTGSLPRAVATTRDGYHLAAGTNDGLRLWRIANESTGAPLTPQLVASAPAGLTPSAVAFHPAGRFFYSADRGSDGLTVCRFEPALDQLQPLGSVSLGNGSRPRALDLSLDGRLLAVACSGDNSVRLLAISPTDGWPTEIDRIDGLSDPRAVAFAPNSKHLACGEFGGDRVSLWSLGAPDSQPELTHLTTVSVTGGPHALGFGPEADSLWVACFTTNRVQRLAYTDSGGLLFSLNTANLPSGSGPVALALRTIWTSL
jgi:6-phosphogluconolactonase (cycloisomerase 2 family)